MANLSFSTIVRGAGVRVFEVPSQHGVSVKCEIRWPRTRQRKRHRFALGLARTLTKTMVVERLLPPLVEQVKRAYGKPKPPLLSALITEFLDRHGKARMPNTFRYYRDGLKPFLSFAGDLPINEITPPLIERFKDAYADRRRRANASLQSLTCLFGRAVAWGYLEHNPVKGVKRCPGSLPKVRMLLDGERDALLRAATLETSHFLYDWILWQLNTAMRPGETAKLLEVDINLEASAVRLYDTKTHDPRWVRLNRTALDIARRRWTGDGKWLFRSSRGIPLTRAIVGQAFRRVCQRAGLRVRPYDLRHDCLSRAALKNTPPALLRDLAGHKTLGMVNHYTQLASGYLDTVVQAIEVRGLDYTGDALVTSAGVTPCSVDGNPLKWWEPRRFLDQMRT